MALTDQRITALYERLSRDDDLVGDSGSIMTQKIMLENYAQTHGFTNCVHYTDDGWSGGNFDRPSWKQLMADVEAGKIGCVIAKDMSRVGRDYLQTGFYTEVVFRQHGVRFIAISNGIDSDDANSSEFAPFMNIMNEWYLRDCSRKQLAAYQVRGRAGMPTTNDAVYGYKKDPADKHHWLIDEEAAEVVRKIFRLTIEGKGPAQIACLLRDSKIERPSHYLARQNRGAQRSCVNEIRAYDWSPNTVSKIIARPEYLGHTVNFRSYKDSYKDKKRKMRPESERLVFENTHEAIVDKETWNLAQAARTVVRRTDTFGEPNPLTGLVYCADCGKRMYNHRGRGNKTELAADPKTGLYPLDRYECSTYNVNYYYSDNNCRSHSITSRALRSLVLETIQTVSHYAIENREEFIQRVRSASDLKHKEDAKELKRRIAKDQKRSAELDTLIKRLYESFALDKISEERFDMLLAEYEKEQEELKSGIAVQQDELDTFEHDTAQIDQFLELTRKYTDFTELTTPMLLEFVDKIEVHASEKDDLGERYQAVEIYLKFIGKFDIPVQEPTPEELVEEERARQRRAYNREKAKESYERKKARKLAAKETASEGASNQ